MKHPPILKQPDTNTRTFRFGYFRAKHRKEIFNIRPTHRAANRALKNQV